ncbi:hypothetical protein DFH06DRAFT_1307780 [Mycena polygramma]|nr:hypothetical protein DFH06DRAFT_1307780 [Mycena polygramma]
MSWPWVQRRRLTGTGEARPCSPEAAEVDRYNENRTPTVQGDGTRYTGERAWTPGMCTWAVDRGWRASPGLVRLHFESSDCTLRELGKREAGRRDGGVAKELLRERGESWIEDALELRQWWEPNIQPNVKITPHNISTLPLLHTPLWIRQRRQKRYIAVHRVNQGTGIFGIPAAEAAHGLWAIIAEFVPVSGMEPLNRHYYCHIQGGRIILAHREDFTRGSPRRTSMTRTDLTRPEGISAGSRLKIWSQSESGKYQGAGGDPGAYGRRDGVSGTGYWNEELPKKQDVKLKELGTCPGMVICCVGLV